MKRSCFLTGTFVCSFESLLLVCFLIKKELISHNIEFTCKSNAAIYVFRFMHFRFLFIKSGMRNNLSFAISIISVRSTTNLWHFFPFVPSVLATRRIEEFQLVWWYCFRLAHRCVYSLLESDFLEFRIVLWILVCSST